MSIGIISLLVLVVLVVIAIPILGRVMGEATRQDEDHSGDLPDDDNQREAESREDRDREGGDREGEDREGKSDRLYGDVRDFEKE